MCPSTGLSHPIQQPLALTSPPTGLSGTRTDTAERSPPSRLACLLHSLVRVSRRGTGCRLHASNLGTERGRIRSKCRSGRTRRTLNIPENTQHPVANLARDPSNGKQPEPSQATVTTRTSQPRAKRRPRHTTEKPRRPNRTGYRSLPECNCLRDYLPGRPLSATGYSDADGHRRVATMHGRRSHRPTQGPSPPRTDELADPQTASTPRASLPTVSRSLELSLQSAFHLSLTVLVRYRTRARIQPWMESTTRLGLQSQTTRLNESGPSSRRSRFLGAYGALTLSGTPFQVDFGPQKDR